MGVANDLDLQNGDHIHGFYRVRSPKRRQTNGRAFDYVLELENLFGATSAIVPWQRLSTCKPLLNDMQSVYVSGHIQKHKSARIIDILDMKPIKDPADPLALLPVSHCPEPIKVLKLRDIVKSLSILPLRTLLEKVFADDDLALPYVKLPASCRHHHAQSAGLLTHSLECACIVAAMPGFSSIEKELGITTALLHDLGKIRTLERGRHNRFNGALLDHESLTLELLASQLAWLDHRWSDGALAIRYLLTWKQQKRGKTLPMMTLAEALAAADRISTGLEREHMAFHQEPEWRSYIQDQGMHRWRPRLEGYSESCEMIFDEAVSS